MYAEEQVAILTLVVAAGPMPQMALNVPLASALLESALTQPPRPAPFQLIHARSQSLIQTLRNVRRNLETMADLAMMASCVHEMIRVVLVSALAHL